MSESSFALLPRVSRDSVSVSDTAHSLGVHDSLRHGGPRNLAAEAQATHPLQQSLDRYESTQRALKFQLQRNLHGVHAPIRLAMEQELVSSSPALNVFGRSSNLHLDILQGKDETLGPGDVLQVERIQSAVNFHSAMERRLRI